jgi:hypothetical protein
MAESQGLAGVLLYSEIGDGWYADFGFEPFSAIDFHIDLNEFRRNNLTVMPSQSDQIQMITAHHRSGEISRLETGLPRELLSQLTRHYGRWLRHQPFGLSRSEEYLAFKFGREEFLIEYSSLNWPKKTIWMLSESENNSAYAITEQSDSTLRLLEIIGSTAGRQAIWQTIFRSALENGVERLRGWEAVIRDFAPSFSLKQLCPPENRTLLNRGALQIYSSERTWGLPMLLPLKEGVSDWWSYYPCPFLELDHF